MNEGLYTWIRESAELLTQGARLLAAEGVLDNALHERIETLLSGVPVPQEDLGFDSPADRLVRYEKALEEIRGKWDFNQPEPGEEDYDDTESAYNNGLDNANYEVALIAREALEKTWRRPAPPKPTALDGIISAYDEAIDTHIWDDDDIRGNAEELENYNAANKLVDEARTELDALRGSIEEALNALADIAGSGLTDDGAAQACKFAEPVLRKHGRLA